MSVGQKRAIELGQDDPIGRPARATVNPYTGRPYTQKYYDILEKREGEICVRCVSPIHA
jgi:hypothetical protein